MWADLFLVFLNSGCVQNVLSQSPVSLLRAAGKVKAGTGKLSIDPADHPAHAAAMLGCMSAV
jgi:hypothetical protein